MMRGKVDDDDVQIVAVVQGAGNTELGLPHTDAPWIGLCKEKVVTVPTLPAFLGRELICGKEPGGTCG